MAKGKDKEEEEELYVSSEILTAATVKNTVFWDVTPCRLIGIGQRFGGILLPPYSG
jgi:hypothetical protein